MDAHALLYRSHFGFRGQRLETSKGEDTSISYSFLSTVLRLLEIQEPPTHFAVVMDHHGKTFRCDADPGSGASFPVCHLLSLANAHN